MSNRKILVAFTFLLAGCGSAPNSPFAGGSLADDPPDAGPVGTGGSPSRIDSEGGIPVRTGSGGVPSSAGSTGDLGGAASGGSGTGGSAPGAGGVISTGGALGAGGSTGAPPLSRPELTRVAIDYRSDCTVYEIPNRVSCDQPAGQDASGQWIYPIGVSCKTTSPIGVSWCKPSNNVSSPGDWCCLPPQ